VLGDLERLAASTGRRHARSRGPVPPPPRSHRCPKPWGARLEFSGVFGRNLEYYTGFVFQIEVDRPQGGSLAIAGGGRYDDMLSDIGSPVAVPAVGCAIHTERLLAAAQGSLT
jgi:histidyl-tRNA synthetase